MSLVDSVWLLGIGFVVSFLDGYGMGANDVSHSFGSSVGSGSLTMLQACTIAIFTEFLGAVLLGSNNVKTISGLAKPENFEEDPGSLMLVMACALLGSSVWTITTAKIGLPVSSTHSISGAVIGGVLLLYGPDYVNWGFKNGVGKIAISWVTSPIIAGVVASFIYLVTRTFVLRHKDSYKRGKIAIPFYFSITILIDTYLILSHSGLTNYLSISSQLIFSAVACVGSFLFINFFMVPWMDRRVMFNEDLKWYHMFYIFFVSTRTFDVEKQNAKESRTKSNSITSKLSRFMTSNATKAITVEDDVNELHDNAEKFDVKTEQLYGYVQVLTAMFASLSHGANDVANAIGPLATIYHIYINKSINTTVHVPIELLAFGGLAIDVGLFTMGYKLMSVLGTEMTFLSASRGFAAELAVSLTVISAASLGIPVSTTQCICGATAGIALSNGTFSALNWKLMFKIFMGWIITMPIAACFSGFFLYIAKLILQ